MSAYLQGATMLAAFAVAVFFLRYWRDTRDRLFGVFSAAFTLFGISRIVLFALDSDSETRTWVYALRAAAFLAILVAIIDKNLAPNLSAPPPEPEREAPAEDEADA